MMGLCRRHAFAHWFVALLLLPAVLGVIPAAPLSAEQALARDLALSICSPNGGQNPEKQPASHDQQCVLCTVGCIACAPASPGNARARLNPRPPTGPAVFAANAASWTQWARWRLGAPPRAPPVSLSV